MAENNEQNPENCTHDCSTCGANCGSRHDPADLIATPHEGSLIKNVIGVLSGKGGVGKSAVTELLAVQLAKAGKKVGILDADITGPSIPKAFGLTERAMGDETTIYPVVTKDLNIDVMSINLLLENPSDPVVWRGALIGGTVRQFYTDVLWKDIDYLLVDMPPGTGDVALTVFQSIPLDGIVVVTTPQDLVSMIVGKAIKMAGLMNIPVLGLIENMSYVSCPDCGKKISIFGESKLDAVAAEYDLPVLARLPIDPTLVSAVDAGQIESYANAQVTDEIDKAIGMIK
ncbi:MAG: Mrp/NBP35 family ATP-binding protein [Eubacterium sp.]|nr:Mrp/NBP35 family ATP-binding protein [Eubacterium sp.]MBQ7201431.1 Mrp/NBP35 family ATP-binding protein [Eubacterium sp.]